MTLIIIWIIFIIFVSASQESSQLYYFLSSSFMLSLTYIYNQLNFIDFSLKSALGFLSLPSILFWYVAFVYNDFLSLTPIEYEAFVSLAFIYIYIVFYIFFEYAYKKVGVLYLQRS